MHSLKFQAIIGCYDVNLTHIFFNQSALRLFPVVFSNCSQVEFSQILDCFTVEPNKLTGFISIDKLII